MARSKAKGQGHWGQKTKKVRHFVPERSTGARSCTPVGKSAHAVHFHKFFVDKQGEGEFITTRTAWVASAAATGTRALNPIPAG